jgi:ESCRT-II complex subunit VPS25
MSNLLAALVEKDLAAYEPPKQTRSVLLHWRLPEEWAEVLYDWVRSFSFSTSNCSPVFFQAVSTGQLNVILTFYDITDPPVESALTNIPIPLLRKAISILGKTSRAQMIAIADGEGVRFLTRAK